MKTRSFNIIYIAAFMTALLLPLMFVNLNGGIVSEKENRVLSARPPVTYAFQHPRSFIIKFDSWFSDNVGFRENMIELYRKYDSSMSSNYRYIDGDLTYLIGQEGHRYFAGVDGWMIDKFMGKPILSDNQLSELASGLRNIKRYLDSKNIPAIVLIIPDKESVYPEYYPKVIKRGPEPIQLDIITEYLRENTAIDVYNIKQLLVDEKNNFMPYNKDYGDLTHYNQIGGFFEYLELMRHIRPYFPNIQPFTWDDVDIAYDKNNIPSVTVKGEKPYVQLDPSFFDNIEANRPFTWELRALKNEDDTLPSILILCDSYANIFSKYIAYHFDETISIHYSNIQHFEKYIDLYKPDIVVFESAERELLGFANCIIGY